MGANILGARNSTNFRDHEYYGPLIDSYTKSILKSGLLLDEDLEVLLSISKFRNFPERSGYKPPLSLLASIISVLGSSLVAKKLKMSLIVIPPIMVSVHFAVLEFKNAKKRKRDNKLIDNLLEILSNIQKLTKYVIRYMKTRYDLGKTKEQNAMFLCGKNVGDFMNSFLQNNINILRFLIDYLKTFTAYSPELEEDFIIIEYLNTSDVLRCENLDDIESCLIYTQKVYDINVLIFSKLLNYVGVLFNSQTLLESNIKILINDTLPEIVKTLQQHYNIIKNDFVSLRHSTNKKSELQLQRDLSKRKNISTKLEATLISSVNNLSLILEKSQNILDRLESGGESNSSEVGYAIIDLRNHTFATYESLDLLCRLYEILSNSNTNQQVEKINKIPNINPTSSETLPTLNYNDDTEPAEEKFELYIGSEESTDERQTKEYEDQSNAYLSLMLQELKQSLKQHERFIEAKKQKRT